jgi:hypothetical protein
MSLVKYINVLCPTRVNHSHSANIRSNKQYLDGCSICKPNINRDNFLHFCDNYILETKKILDKNQIFTLQLIFSIDKYYLPPELISIIFKNCEFNILEKIPILLNYDGIKHMWKCVPCSKYFINYLEDETCPKHIVPRKNSRRNFEF